MMLMGQDAPEKGFLNDQNRVQTSRDSPVGRKIYVYFMILEPIRGFYGDMGGCIKDENKTIHPHLYSVRVRVYAHIRAFEPIAHYYMTTSEQDQTHCRTRCCRPPPLTHLQARLISTHRSIRWPAHRYQRKTQRMARPLPASRSREQQLQECLRTLSGKSSRSWMVWSVTSRSWGPATQKGNS